MGPQPQPWPRHTRGSLAPWVASEGAITTARLRQVLHGVPSAGRGPATSEHGRRRLFGLGLANLGFCGGCRGGRARPARGPYAGGRGFAAGYAEGDAVAAALGSPGQHP
jgi:hypothetical protein